MAHTVLRALPLAALLLADALKVVAAPLPAPIAVPSDPRAQYTALKVESAGRNLAYITTQRVGPSGTTYSKRLVDCQARTFKYIAEGDTLAALKNESPSPNMSPLVEGSISSYVLDFACSIRPGH